MRKKFLLMLTLLILALGGGGNLFAQNVAKVGNTEYATIDEAIAAWTNGTTLTLLNNVNLTDVITLSSQEHHYLALGTCTMTAASGKNAIEVKSYGRGDRKETGALTITADATNPGSINAVSNACIYYKYDATLANNQYDRPIIYIKGGVFVGNSYSGISCNGHDSAQDKCATFDISGGTFNCGLNLTKAKLIVSGGTFNNSVACTGGGTSHRQISGGTFKAWGWMTADAASKFWVGTSQGNYNVGVYVDDEGYLVVGGPIVTEPNTDSQSGVVHEASTANYSGWNSYLKYSSAKDNGLYYTSVEEAFADNNKSSGSVTVYVKELDMTGISYKGTIVVPAESTLTITNAPANLKVTNEAGETITPNANGTYSTIPPVAQIGAVPYYTLADAINAATNGQTITITLINNIELTETATIPAEKIIIIDLNGKNITSGYQSGSTSKHIYPIDNYGNLTIKDEQGTGSITGRGIYVQDGCKLTIESGKVYGIDSNGGSALYQYGGDIVIDGGLVEQKAEGTYNFAINAAGGSVTVNGGKIAGNHGAIAAVGAEVVINNGEFVCTGTVGMTDNVLYVDGSSTMTINGGTFTADNDGSAGGCCVYDANGKATINGGTFGNSSGGDVWGTTGTTIKGGTFENLIEKQHIAAGYELNADGTVVAIPVAEVNGTKYTSIEEALAAAQSGDEIIMLSNVTLDAAITLPAGITFNGNGKQITGTIIAAGDITFAGVTKVGDLDFGAYSTVVNIPAGASLQLNGSDRMSIGFGTTFNITGTIADAKTADKATLTPSLVIPGASFSGTAGLTFNVTNAYISVPSSYCSSSKSASGTFDFNITNSIWESANKFAFEEQSVNAKLDFALVNSVLTTGSHLVFGTASGEEGVVIDNSLVNVGTSRQIENCGTMTVKNGSVVNGAVATSSNAKNPGTVIVENATYAVTGEFSGSDLGTGTLIIKKGANVSVGSIKAGANVTVDATDMVAGDEINFTANLSQFTGTLSVINNDKLEAQIVDGKIVLVAKPVAKIGEQGYATLNEAFAAATEGQTITLLDDATPALTSQRAITKAAVIDLGGKTLNLTEDDLYFGTTTFKNGTIVVDPSVKPSTAVFWMFANQTLTFYNVKVVATGVTGTYLIGLDGNNSDLNLLNGSEILVENTTALDLDIICVNASTGNDIKVENSKVNVTNLDGRVFFRGNYTVKDSEVNLAGITKAGFRIEAGQTLSIEGTSKVNIEGELRDGGIHLTDLSATYTKAEAATVNATVNEITPAAVIGTQKFASLQEAINAVQNGVTITLTADITENVTLTEKTGLTYTIDGDGKTMNGTIIVNSLSDTNDNRRITVKNIKFVDSADDNVDFISSVNTNHYPRLTIEGCTFTGSGNDGDVAVRLKSSHSVVIENCTGTGLHSFLQNTSGWNLTIKNVTVTDSKSGLALGTVQGVTVKDCNITADGYGIRMDAQYNNNAVIESNKVNAFIPVVVRKAEVDSNITFKGTNTMTQTNNDGLWCAIGATEYETNGEMPTAATGKVSVTLNDAGLNADGIYGNSINFEGLGTEESPYLINNLNDLKFFRNNVNAGNNYSGKYVKLTANIDLKNEEWEPIGYMGKNFVGNFDGGNKTISNLKVTKELANASENNGVGLFGRVDSPATIKNLTIENATVKGSLYVGAVVGYAYTGNSIENVTVRGHIAIDAWWYAGVIGGNGYMSLVNNCHVIGDDDYSYIKGNNGSYIGGIWGFRGEGANNITNCTVTNLAVEGVDRVGGISGMAHYGNTISGCSVDDVTIAATDEDATTVGIIAGACQGTVSEPSTITYSEVVDVTVTIGGNNVDASIYGTNIDGTTPYTNYVARIGGMQYITLADAVAAANDGETIEFLPLATDKVVPMNASLYGKSVTITGTATVDWSKGWLFVGRGGEGNATLTFNEAYLTSASDNSTYGIHVSGREKNTTNKYDGTVVINNSTIELDYLINRGTMTLDNKAILTVKNGFGIAGRPASETENDEDATATITLDNESKLVVNNHNGMGLGQAAEVLEGLGVMNINSGSTFECTQDFLVTANGTMNVNGGVVTIAENKKLDNKGAVVVTGNYNSKLYVKKYSGNAIQLNNGNLVDTYFAGRVDAFGTNNISGTTTIGGILSLGYGTNPTEQVVVNIKGNFNGTNVLVYTNNGVDNILNVGNANDERTTVHFAQLGAFADVNVVNADVTYGYAFIRNNFNATNSTFEIKGGVNTYFSGNAEVVLDNTTWNLSGYANIGSYGGDMYGNADVTLKNGSSMTATNLGIEVSGEKVVKLKLEDNSSLTATKLTNQGTIVLASTEATLTSNECGNVTTSVPNKVVSYSNGNYILIPAVAKIGETPYASLQDAIKAVQAGETIELIANVEASEVIMIGKNVTINGNNKKVTSNANRVFRVTVKDTEVTLNEVNMVNTAVRVGQNDIRGISVDDVTGVKLTLNNCSVDFTDESACDWSYAVNVVGGSGHDINVNGGTYEGANVINVRGAGQTVLVKDAILTSLYPNNDQYYGACIWVSQNQNSSVEATGNTFNGSNAVAFNVGYTPVTESNNTDNTTRIIAEIDGKYYTLQEAIEAAGTTKTTITIKASFSTDDSYTIAAGQNITLNLNGKTITGTDNATGSFGLINNKGTLTIVDGTRAGGAITLKANVNRGWNAYSSVISNTVGGKLTVNGGTIEHLGGTDMAYAIDNLTNGKGTYAETEINGGTVKSTYRAIRQFLNGIEAQNILTVNGGTIEGTNKSIWMQDPSKNANTGTLIVNENANLYGDVYLSVTEGSTEWPVEVAIVASAIKQGTVLTSNVPEGYLLVAENGLYTVETIKVKEQTINLNNGWTWVSLFVDATGESGLESFENQLEQYNADNQIVQIKNQTKAVTYQSYYGNYGWYGNLKSLAVNDMYMVKIEKDNVVVELEDYKVNPADYEFNLVSGWTWLGFPSTSDAPVAIEYALQNITPNKGDQIKSQEGFATYTNNKWYGNLSSMTPGMGYMYKNNSDNTVILKYPAEVNYRGVAPANITAKNNLMVPNMSKYANNMSIIAVVNIDGEELMTEDFEVAVFAGEELRGSARPIYVEDFNSYMLFLTVYGEASEELTFKYYDLNSGEELNLFADSKVVFEINSTVGSLEEALVLNYGTLSIDETSLNGFNVYPNPVNRDNAISFETTFDKVEVYNSLGVVVAEYNNVDKIDGIEAAGIYVIKVTNDNVVKYCRVIVK